ncbi:PREDICTED: uncharacterized protein LOC18610106 [Theobroma cacao]|uniref:Uncharacterized protein LOC18610106 n=1 Tax=Theobroma cacao TaxID=3641 RepID=A0AB32VT87_THECC|nr:PREDICTED: uncharacterized protein LOC18610106 [Theobroma cacao]
MYVTRPFSMYKKFASELFSPPPEGPNFGVLVIQDEEPEVIVSCCFGLCKLKDYNVRELPFPQNKELLLQYRVYYRGDDDSANIRKYDYYPVLLIPVLNQPLSSNRYYAILPRGWHKGCAMFLESTREFKRRGRDHHLLLQLDGFPPNLLRIRGLQVFTSSSRIAQLSEAPGLDATLRACLPELNFPLSCKSSSPVVVGKWYSPFMFIKEGIVKDHIRTSMYYEITLVHKWKQIFECENHGNKGNAVAVDVSVHKELVSIAGREVHERNVADQVMWFRSSSDAGGEVTVGLSLAIVERMKWEEERFGWISGNEEKPSVTKGEEYAGIVGWKKFGCYVVVESFILKRMNGSLILTYDFNHTKQIRSRWD